ncbi:uncharacterized protein LAESUDRAFT_644408 [Laetiporus sulphureus 93-53]|uniref:Rhodopsin domain-containing protein n=1 Tax=Laetiporus sulphureus 93-53 TaxID=1314785 RepID=A0A165GEN6_9APHY|nr:uncharacterized protein LAESUDRAFT_644408 [Laetiporus sulphureus 93-53]KZT10244.1 hypothetical protein LAESUDRAFT_644408 [Laetiporus sulphureus 93-53]
MGLPVVATVCAAAAMCTTSLRLWYRYSRRHLGYDDAWAALALVTYCFLLAGAYLRSDRTATYEQRVTGYFMLNATFTTVIWFARLSILFSIMRIIPTLMVLRRYAYAAAVLFLAEWIVLLVQKTWTCEHYDAWKTDRAAQCVMGNAVGAVELATDISADLILVILPIRLFWDISISEPRRKLLITIFSASLITTVVSVVHDAYELGPDRNAEAIAAHVEASTSLVICNLAVLVTWLVRAIRQMEDVESGRTSDYTSSNKHRRNKSGRDGTGTRLTTIRFEQPAIVLSTMDESASDACSSKTAAAAAAVRGELEDLALDPAAVSFAEVKKQNEHRDSYGDSVISK